MKILSQAPPGLRRLDTAHKATTRRFEPPDEPLQGLCWNILAFSCFATCSYMRVGGYACRCWKCKACVWRNGQKTAESALTGLQEAQKDGVIAASLTLTCPGDRLLHLGEFRAGFKSFSRSLSRKGLKWDHYLATWGSNPKTGRLHRHLLLYGEKSVPQSTYTKYAERAGLGHTFRNQVTFSNRSLTYLANYFATNAVLYALMHREYTEGPIVPVAPSKSRYEEKDED